MLSFVKSDLQLIVTCLYLADHAVSRALAALYLVRNGVPLRSALQLNNLVAIIEHETTSKKIDSPCHLGIHSR
jgi:hypothetical protein